MNRIVTVASLYIAYTSLALAQEGETVGLPPAPDGKAWKMVWNDEFDGNCWTARSGWPGPKENERAAGGAPRRSASTVRGIWQSALTRTATRWWTVASPRRASSNTLSVTILPGFDFRTAWPLVGFLDYRSRCQKVGDGGRDGTEIDISDTVTPFAMA